MIAFLFPGQGSQSVGMGCELASNFEVARRTFEEADDALNFGISRVCFEGAAEDLQLTENTQPALLTVSIAALRAAQNEGLTQPEIVAGHSLGEYSALVAARALEFSDAVKLVRKRGGYMQQAVPAGIGAMAAIVGGKIEMIDAACAQAASQHKQVCAPANINSKTQIVIAGHTEAVETACNLLREQAAQEKVKLRAIKLPVSAPFHCSLMMDAQERLAEDLGAANFKDLQIPLINNVEAAVITAGDDARQGLIRQVSAPVQWLETMNVLREREVEMFVEIGAGKVLSGLIKQTIDNAQIVNIENLETLKTALQVLNQKR